MAQLTFAQVKERTRPGLELQIPTAQIHLLTDSWLVDQCNEVAEAINQKCELHFEHFSRTTTDDQTNYTLNGPIEKIYLVKYQVDDYYDQVWARVTKDNNGYGRLVFKSDPGENQLDIWYTRSILEISNNDTDTIDLPAFAQHWFIELVKLRIRIMFNLATWEDYERLFQLCTRRIIENIDYKANATPNQGRKYWHEQVGSDLDAPLCDTVYDITNNEVGAENIAYNASTTNYYFIT